MIPLDTAGEEGQPLQAADFPGGLQPFGEGGDALAPGLVQAPGAKAMVVANSADEAINSYMEGMASWMGHFRNFGRSPRAVEAVDRSLEEGPPGVYSTTALVPDPGIYDVAIFLDAPRVIHCFTARGSRGLQRPRPNRAGRWPLAQ